MSPLPPPSVHHQHGAQRRVPPHSNVSMSVFLLFCPRKQVVSLLVMKPHFPHTLLTPPHTHTPGAGSPPPSLVGPPQRIWLQSCSAESEDGVCVGVYVSGI